MKRLWTICLLFVLLATSIGCSPAPTPSPCPGEPIRVLFIGNSYTYVNDLPATFARLACSAGHPVETGMSARGGWRLTDHLASADTVKKLDEKKWNFVILQEQSELPALWTYREQNMYAAARELVSEINSRGATPLFFLTWAHRDGLPSSHLYTFSEMQVALDDGYYEISAELGVGVVPVGDAWSNAMGLPDPDLWDKDGSHPNPRGTYLAACVFYATIFAEDPHGLSFLAGLNEEDARALQSIAASTVLK